MYAKIKCQYARKFELMVYQKTFKISGTHDFVKVEVMRTWTILSMVFIYRIIDPICGTLINFAMQNKASDSVDKKRCHRFEVRLKKAC